VCIHPKLATVEKTLLHTQIEPSHILKKLAVILSVAVTLQACDQKPEDIQVSDLHTLCDHLDAMERLLDVALTIPEPPNSEGQNQDVWNHRRLLQRKYIEIRESAGSRFDVERIKECPSWPVVSGRINSAEGITD